MTLQFKSKDMKGWLPGVLKPGDTYGILTRKGDREMNRKLYRCDRCGRTRFYKREEFDIDFSDVCGISKMHITEVYICKLCGRNNYLDNISKQCTKEV